MSEIPRPKERRSARKVRSKVEDREKGHAEARRGEESQKKGEEEDVQTCSARGRGADWTVTLKRKKVRPRDVNLQSRVRDGLSFHNKCPLTHLGGHLPWQERSVRPVMVSVFTSSQAAISSVTPTEDTTLGSEGH